MLLPVNAGRYNLAPEQTIMLAVDVFAPVSHGPKGIKTQHDLAPYPAGFQEARAVEVRVILAHVVRQF